MSSRVPPMMTSRVGGGKHAGRPARGVLDWWGPGERGDKRSRNRRLGCLTALTPVLGVSTDSCLQPSTLGFCAKTARLSCSCLADVVGWMQFDGGMHSIAVDCPFFVYFL